MNLLRKLALWLVFDGPRLPGWLVPHLFGFGIGAKPVKVEKEMEDDG